MRGEPHSLTLARGTSRVLDLLDEMEERLSTGGVRHARTLSETACSMSASCRLSAVLKDGSSQAGTWAAIVSPDKGPAVLAAMMICAYSVKPSVARVRRGLREAKRILGELGDPEGETIWITHTASSTQCTWLASMQSSSLGIDAT